MLVKNVFYNILYDDDKTVHWVTDINIDIVSPLKYHPIILLSINEKLKLISTLCLRIGTKLIITIYN